MPDAPDSLIQAIRGELKRQGRSQRWLAKALDVHQQQVNRWLNHGCRTDNAARMAETLGLRLRRHRR